MAVAGDGRKHVVQAVHDLFEVVPSSSSWAEGETRTCSLVVIGRHLNQRRITKGFEGCRVASRPVD